MYSGDYLQLLTTVAWLLAVLVAGLVGSLAGTVGGSRVRPRLALVFSAAALADDAELLRVAVWPAGMSRSG